jgi:hypothetical protein
VRAVAVCEPVVFEAMDEPFAAEWRETAGQSRFLFDQDRAEEAVRLFLGTAGTPEEEALFSGEEAFIAAMARYLPVDLAEFEAVSTNEAVSPTALVPQWRAQQCVRTIGMPEAACRLRAVLILPDPSNCRQGRESQIGTGQCGSRLRLRPLPVRSLAGRSGDLSRCRASLQSS